MMDPRGFPMRPPPPKYQPSAPNHPSRPPQIPAIFHLNLDDPKLEKKWRNPKEDITDYFNYGMNEETWRLYAEKVTKLAGKVEKFSYDHGECSVLDDRLPLEFGGFGTPYFEKIRNLPYFNVIKKNKERFFFQHRYDPGELKDQLQNALTADFVEENYRDVKSSYDAIVPDLLTMRHKLPQISSAPTYRTVQSNRPPYMGLPMNNRIPAGTTVGGAPAGLLNRLNAARPADGKFGVAAPGFSANDLRALTMNFNIADLFPNIVPSERESSPKKQNKSGTRSRNSRNRSPSVRSSVSRERRKKAKRERSRSAKKEKKRREDTQSPSPDKKKKKADKKKDKERDPNDESRADRKKAKKSSKADGRNESRRKSKDRQKSPVTTSRKESEDTAQRRKESIVLSKDKKETSDIRMRIQPRK